MPCSKPKRRLRGCPPSLSLNIVFFVAVTGLGAAFARSADRSEFKIYNALLYEELPELIHCGLEPIDVIYQHLMGIDWTEHGGDLRENFDETVAQRRSNDVDWLVLDIEAFRPSEARYLAWALQHYRNALPGKKMGFYGFFPPYSYRGIILNRSIDEFDEEQSGYAYFALAEEVDAFFPLRNTHYARPEEWETFTRGIVRRAREMTENVKPFIWPQYHPGSDQTIGLCFIEPVVWRAQLELLREIADGVVIWGGWRDRDEERLV